MSDFYKLKLVAIPDAWRLFSMRKHDVAFQKFAKQIFTRDSYTCQFCGFQASQYLDVVNVDLNYRNNKLSNMVTSCCFCSSCFFLDSVGRDDYGGGNLIYLPEITQNELNAFCHVLFCSMHNTTIYRSDAQNIYRSLKLRSQIVEKKIGDGMSDPALLGRMLIEATEQQRMSVDVILSPLRLLPSYAKYSTQIESWANSALNDLSE